MSREILVGTLEDSRRRFAAIAEGALRIAIPGGSAASALLPALVAAPIDWPRVEVFWVDERDVPAGDPDSNARLAREIWLSHVPVPASAVHELRGDPAAYERLLGRPPRLDLVLLGVGEDGHVASLFPGHALLSERERYVAALDDAPKRPPRRLTMTLPALAAARRLVVYASGEGKAAALREAIEDTRSELPLARVLRAAADATILLDRGAASTIGARMPRHG